MIGPQAKYKLKYNFNSNNDVHSQNMNELECQQEDDEYQMDSFCNDSIVYEDDDENNEEIGEIKKPKKKRRRITIESP